MSNLIVLAASLILAVWGVVENAFHQRRIRGVRIRINVNGTRGKSTVTRLIAAGLRAGGLRTVAKTTGTMPCLILPDGSEERIKRRGAARISEHVYVTRRAHSEHAEALVVECMALRPENQRVYQHMLVKANIGVITNIRADHLDVMGPDLQDVATTLAITVPEKGIMVSLDGPHLDIVREECERRGTELVIADPGGVGSAELAKFPYTSFAENVALALRVCELAGVSRAVALHGMIEARPDPGVSPAVDISVGGRTMHVVNASAANDVESAMRMWKDFVSPHASQYSARFLIVNNRADRPQRVKEMSQLAAVLPVDCVLYVGDLRPLAVRLTPGGTTRAVAARSGDPSAILEEVARRMPDGGSAILFLAGNTKGMGGLLTDYILARAGVVSS